MIKYYFSKFRNVLFLIIISVLFGLIKNILLGRMLTKYDFGIYALSMTVIGMLYPILLFGQQRGLVRFFVSHKIEDYNWRKPISVLINISFVLSMIIVPSITWYYQMNFLGFKEITTERQKKKTIKKMVILIKLVILFFIYN